MASPIMWFPLNGTTENKGTDTVTVSAYNIVYDTENTRYWNYARFDTDVSKYIHIPDAPELQNEITWNVWVYLPADNVTTFMESSRSDYMSYIMSQGRDSNGGLQLYFDGSTSKYKVKQGNSSQSITVVSDDISDMTDRWVMLTVVIASDKVRLYVNGTSVSDVNRVPNIEYGGDTSGLVIGRMAYELSSTTDYYPFIGYMSDIRIFDTALSQKEIDDLYRGLVVQYPFDSPKYECKSNIQPSFNVVAYDGMTMTKKFDNDGEYYNFIYNNQEKDNANKQIGFRLDTYPFIEGHYYYSAMDIRINGYEGITSLELRGARVTDDYLDGMISCNVPSTGIGEWKRYSTYTYMPPDDISLSDGTVLTKQPSIEIYSSDLASGSDDTTVVRMIDFDVKNPTVIDMGTSLPDNWESYEYEPIGSVLDTAPDTSGLGHDLTFGNGNLKYKTIDGRRGVYFDGYSYLWLPSGLFKAMICELTVSFWIYISSTDTPKYIGAILVPIAGFGEGLSIGVNGTDTDTALFVYLASKSVGMAGDGSSVASDSWHHMVMTFDYGKCRTYMDTELLGETTWAHYALNMMTDQYSIGNCYYDLSETHGETFSSPFTLSDFRMYTKALSIDDITELYKEPISVTDTGVVNSKYITSDDDGNPNLFDIEKISDGGVTKSSSVSDCDVFYHHGKPFGFHIIRTGTDPYIFNAPTTYGKESDTMVDMKFREHMIPVLPNTSYEIEVEFDVPSSTGKMKNFILELTAGFKSVDTYKGFTTSPYTFTTSSTTRMIMLRFGEEFADDSPVTEFNITNIKLRRIDSESQKLAFSKYTGLSGNLTETGVLIDPDAETMSFDGATWLKIFHHNSVGGTNLFTDLIEAKSCNKYGKYSTLGSLDDSYLGDDGKFEFLYETPIDNQDRYIRWKQITNPVISKLDDTNDTLTAVDGLEFVGSNLVSESNFFGLNLNDGSNTLLDMEPGSTGWSGSIGTLVSWKTNENTGLACLPGPKTVLEGCTNEIYSVVDLWVRIDNIPASKVSIFSNKMVAKEFTEY